MVKTTLLLIRHGQTDWNAAKRWQGHLDLPLNDEGTAQARALASRLKSWGIQALYSSDLKRAALTAHIIGESIGLKPMYDVTWRERDVGDFGGLTGAEVQERFPAVWAEMKNGIINPPGGEHHLAFHDRATAAYKKLLVRHENELVAVVTHGGLISRVLAAVLGIGADRRGNFVVSGNTGLSIIEESERGVYLTRLNDTAHLE